MLKGNMKIAFSNAGNTARHINIFLFLYVFESRFQLFGWKGK